MNIKTRFVEEALHAKQLNNDYPKTINRKVLFFYTTKVSNVYSLLKRGCLYKVASFFDLRSWSGVMELWKYASVRVAFRNVMKKRCIENRLQERDTQPDIVFCFINDYNNLTEERCSKN